MLFKLNTLPVSNKIGANSSSILKSSKLKTNTGTNLSYKGSELIVKNSYGSSSSYSTLNYNESYINNPTGAVTYGSHASSSVVTGASINKGKAHFGTVSFGTSTTVIEKIKRYEGGNVEVFEEYNKTSSEEKLKKEKEQKLKEEQEKKKKEALLKKAEEQKLKEGYVNSINSYDGFNISADEIASTFSSGTKTIVTLNNGNEITLENGAVASLFVKNQGVTYTFSDGKIIGCDNSSYTDIFNASNSSRIQYGGNQMDFQYHANELAQDPYVLQKIYNAYGNNVSYQQIIDYLYAIESCGCHFTAVVNSVFKQYVGKEQEFLNTFGYPMYKVDENGNVDYNYEPMIAEIHSYYWTHNFDYEGDGTWDQFGANNIDSATWMSSATGMNDDGARVCLEYLRDTYGISGAHESSYDITTDNWSQYDSQGKTVILNARSYNLYHMDGTSAGYNGQYGHAMTITGVTTDPYGYPAYIVSNWGEQYICTLVPGYDSAFAYYDIVD